MLPAKVTAKVRGLLIRRVARLVRALEERRPDSLLADMARLIGDAGAMLDPEAHAAAPEMALTCWSADHSRAGPVRAQVTRAIRGYRRQVRPSMWPRPRRWMAARCAASLPGGGLGGKARSRIGG